MYFKKLTINGVDYPVESVIEGTTNPGTSTEANIGQVYANTTTGAFFRCKGKSGNDYIWFELSTKDDLTYVERYVKINKTAVGTDLKIEDAADLPLTSIQASEDCNVTITGKNLISGDFSQVSWSNRDDETVIIGKGAHDYLYPSRISVSKVGANIITLTCTANEVLSTGVTIFLACKPSTKYAISYTASNANSRVSLMGYGSDKAFLRSYKENAENGYTFTTGDDVYYLGVSFGSSAKNSEITYTNFQLEEGNAATSFVPYQGKKTLSVESGVTPDISDIYTHSPFTHIYNDEGATMTVVYGENTNIQQYVDSRDEKLETNMAIHKEVSGTDIMIREAGECTLKSISAEENCTITVKGKNLISGAFERVDTFADVVDETILVGKGTDDYRYPSRLSNVSIAENNIGFTFTSDNPDTAGVAIYIACKPLTEYVLTFNATGGGKCGIIEYNAEKTRIRDITRRALDEYPFITGATAGYLAIVFLADTKNVPVTFRNFQLEVGSHATSFAPHQKTESIQFEVGSVPDLKDITIYKSTLNIYNDENSPMNVVYDIFTVDYAVKTCSELESKIGEVQNSVSQQLAGKSFVAGTDIFLKDSVDGNLIGLTSETDCTVHIAGRNMISADFPLSVFATAGDETVIMGKAGGNYTPNTQRINYAKLDGDKITLKTNDVATGIGIKVAVRPNKYYRLTYDMSGSGSTFIGGYSSSVSSNGGYVYQIKNGAPSGFVFQPYNANYTIDFIVISFLTTQNVSEVVFSKIMLEELESQTEPAHDFVPYQKKQTITITGGVLSPEEVYSYYPFTHIYSDNDASLSTTYFVSPSQYVENVAAEKLSTEDARSKMFVSSLNTLDGWSDHSKAFSDMFVGKSDAEGFMFVTDSHFMAKTVESEWRDYMYSIFAYWEQMYYATPCSFFLHGGDWLGATRPHGEFMDKLSAIGGAFRSRFDKYALVVGNHEIKYNDDNSSLQYVEPAMVNNTLLSGIKSKKNYYIHDAKTFRLYVFDSYNSGPMTGTFSDYSIEQLSWFVNSLLSETSEHIAIAIHILFNTEGSHTYDSTTIKPFPAELIKCASAYNNRETYSWGNDISASFANATGTVEFVIAGHEHGDGESDTTQINVDGTVLSYKIPFILTTNATEYSETVYSNLPLPLDLIMVNWETNKLTAYRAARGSVGTTREITMASGQRSGT